MLGRLLAQKMLKLLTVSHVYSVAQEMLKLLTVSHVYSVVYNSLITVFKH